jgi:hypothetical protein
MIVDHIRLGSTTLVQMIAPARRCSGGTAAIPTGDYATPCEGFHGHFRRKKTSSSMLRAMEFVQTMMGLGMHSTSMVLFTPFNTQGH